MFVTCERIDCMYQLMLSPSQLIQIDLIHCRHKLGGPAATAKAAQHRPFINEISYRQIFNFLGPFTTFLQSRNVLLAPSSPEIWQNYLNKGPSFAGEQPELLEGVVGFSSGEGRKCSLDTQHRSAGVSGVESFGSSDKTLMGREFSTCSI